MANEIGRLVVACALTLVATIPPCLAESLGVSELFGPRVQAVAGVKHAATRGDFDDDGKTDTAWFVQIAPAGDGKSVLSDVRVIRLYGGEPLRAGSSGHGVAIVLSGTAQKFLVIDLQPAPYKGFFDSPPWSEIADWDKTSPAPLHSAKRNSPDLKGYPCLGKGDPLLLVDGAGIDEALVWTGKTFANCVDPTNDP
jgi:hypothetical protein